MALTPPSEIREVTGISDAQKQRILDFLQGAVYCWCKNQPHEWFSMRNLMGGENFDWGGTPLQPLYDKQIQAGLSADAAVERAGQESGWLLKQVISTDRRTFETKHEEQIRKYRWIPSS